MVFAANPAKTASAAPLVNFAILHTNDFHGNLQLSGSNPGGARVAQKVADVRAQMGAQNVLLLDAGDIMQGSLISNLQQGLPTFDYYRTLGYNAATFGNHEFDWGQAVLGDRIAQAEAPATADETPMQMITANITRRNAAGECTWEPFNASVSPYEVFTVGSAPNQVRVGVIGVGSIETPYITIAEATDGLCFRDPFESIQHYYAALDAASDVMVVLSHNGLADGGYGYGFTVYGDRTLAQRLNTAGTPVSLIIGGHSHTDVTAAYTEGNTLVVQAHYAGRKVGRANFVYDMATGTATVTWQRIVVAPADPEYAPVKAVIDSYVNDPTYQAMINQPVGYAQVDLLRNYNGDSMMGNFVDDAILNAHATDANPANDMDFFFNNAGGLRIDWCDQADPAAPGGYVWVTDATLCSASGLWNHDAMLLNYGQMFQILPFGNATAIGDMTGAQVMELLNQAATLFKGALAPAGIRYKFYRYSDALPGPQPYAWGAYDVQIYDRQAHAWVELDLAKTYRVGTNEFLAPAGQDGYTPFKYMTNISYWGDMLDAVNSYVSATYTAANPYRGPNGDGTLDGRIARNGDGDDTYEDGEVVPVTVLHHNDSHGRLLAAGTTPGYSNLATLIKQERQHNAARTLLLNAGDSIQGDSMMYYFKSAGLGYAADGTPLPADLSINPIVKAFNAMQYNAWTLGNHEFNFGKEVFSTIGQAEFPVLQANVSDTGEYGLASVPVEPYTVATIGPEALKIAILGIGNHRIPNYELPSNIPGLTFRDPIETAKAYAPALQDENDAVIALTHIGFTTDPKSVEVDNNVDTYFATQVSGVDAIIGGHSHTNPSTGFGPYRWLPTFVQGPGNAPVLVTQANRYNTFLGEVILGMLPDGEGGYTTVARTGRYIQVTTATPEDAEIKALVQPYQDMINAYNNTEIGQTTAPIDTTLAFTQETNGANLQADASVSELRKNGIDVDFHLSGAMTNRLIAVGATPEAPYTLKVSDMFAAMPYENSLLALRMNGPQLKAILERAYRNFYYYNYVPGYGGYSYYTTCMIDINAGGKITYNDRYPEAYDPTKSYVVSLEVNGEMIDFNDAETYYTVSTVNYLAAGSCNFNNDGKTLWPLDQIVADTQFYVRDAVIEYIKDMGIVSPAIEGRLVFLTDSVAPTAALTLLSGPQYVGETTTYITKDTILRASAADETTGIGACDIHVSGPAERHIPCKEGDTDFSLSGPDGLYTITLTVSDGGGNAAEPVVASYYLDSKGPVLGGSYDGPSYTYKGKVYIRSATPVVITAVDAGSGVAACTLSVDGAEPVDFDLSPFTLPAVEGKHSVLVVCTDNLGFTSQQAGYIHVDDTAPVVKISTPKNDTYLHHETFKLDFSAKDAMTGILSLEAWLDGEAVKDDQKIDLLTLTLGEHTLVVTATDKVGNQSTAQVTFTVDATVKSLRGTLTRLYTAKAINKTIKASLDLKLAAVELLLKKGKVDLAVETLHLFIGEVDKFTGKGIQPEAAKLLIVDAEWVIAHLQP
jgi:2',3'-cyclic-nucleotide 2'-phosphodiesterase (5'-nucleotidase family)